MGPSVPPRSQPGAAPPALAADPIPCPSGTITHLQYFLLNEADLLGETCPGSVLVVCVCVQMELAGQMNFHEDPAEKQWDPRLKI